jgi:hypothetical protein
MMESLLQANQGIVPALGRWIAAPTGFRMGRTAVSAAIVALWALAAPCADAAELRTRSYVIQITENCPEGEVGCRDVSYVGKNIRTGKSIALQGQAVMRLCADRVTPCSHEGYRFTSAKVEYRITQDGLLLVTRGSEVLVEERGQWQAAAAQRIAATGTLAQRVGVQLQSGYAGARAKLLAASWVADSGRGESGGHKPLAYRQYPEVLCGQGYDAVCSGRFEKSGQAILLTIDQRTSTLPVTSVDED